MKKVILSLLVATQFFNGEIRALQTRKVHALHSEEIHILRAAHTNGPIFDFCSKHAKALGVVAAAYFIAYGIHFALNRVPAEEVTELEYEMLGLKIKNGDATLNDVLRFVRLFVFPGSKEDIVERTTITQDINGTKIEIQDKFVRRAGTGLAAWFKFRVLDNLEKITKPVLSLCGILWIVNNVLKDGTIPGQIK